MQLKRLKIKSKYDYRKQICPAPKFEEYFGAKLSTQDKIEFASHRRFSLAKFWRYHIIKSISAANTFVR
ncbi:hypothetical protein F5ESL0259_01875 [Lactobacillus sp. ESL0259]|nr:hypothetical protein F5ESL0259_01875 [Lactobacillus sp. ESL0259]